jgi:hypothetical protein
VGTPDGFEIVNLIASMLMAIALVPYGVHIIANALDGGEQTTASRLEPVALKDS